MSVDTSHVRPTSTLSPWQRVLFQQIADREIRNAAQRAELNAQPVQERTAADALKDVQRYTKWLTLPVVQANAFLKDDIEAKLATAEDELKLRRRQTCQAGAR